jgi:hypothetical protein
MNITREHLMTPLRWIAAHLIRVVAGLAAVAAVAVFGVTTLRDGATPGSPTSIGLGIAAAVSLLIVMGYSARRAVPAVRVVGAVRGYLQLHIWFGSLFLLLFLLHTGFRPPAGVLSVTLWLLTLWVVASGAVGLALQWVVPRVLRQTTPFEVNVQRIPQLVGELRGRAEALAAAGPPGLRHIYEREFAPDMAAARVAPMLLLGSAPAVQQGGRGLEVLERTLGSEDASTLAQIREIHDSKRALDVHFTLQRILRLWLVMHLPVAVVLLVLVMLHVFFVLYF